MAPIGYSSDRSTDCKKVYLCEYDLNDVKKGWNDWQRAASRVMLGETPHLAIVVYGREFEVEKDGPRWLFHGEEEKLRCNPRKMIFLGETALELEQIMEFYYLLAEGRFCPGSYDILTNNCIHFAEALCIHLLGKKLPSEFKMVPEKKILRASAIATCSVAAVAGMYKVVSSVMDKRKAEKQKAENAIEREMTYEKLQSEQ